MGPSTPLAAIRSIGETTLHTQVTATEAICSILGPVYGNCIDALLQLSRADAGEIRQQTEAVDMAALASRETVDFLNVPGRRHDHHNIRYRKCDCMD